MKWMSFIRYLFSLNILLGLTLAFSSSSYGATFILENADAPNKGLNNKKAVSPVGGNPGTTLGGQRRRVFEAVFDLLEGTIESDVEIRVKVSFDPLACERYSGQVGGAGPIGVASDFSGAPEPDVLYPIALANRHAGLDLEPDYADIEVIINRSIDFNNDCLYRTNFYYGLDGREPARKINLFTIVLHEVIHGLGFLSLADIDGSFLFDLKDPFSQYIYDDQYNKYWPEMTNAQRADSYDNSYNVTWRGPEITFRGENVGGTANESYWNGQYLRYPYLYAPSPIEPGSSISHWNDITPDQLMEPYTTGPVVEVSDYERAALFDLGWPLTNPLPVVDTDGDGVRDRDDHFPGDPNESQDNDGDRIGDSADTDDDNDQMPDSWESTVGTDPLVDDAESDPDADSYTNFEEMLARTDPLNIDNFPEPLTGYFTDFSNPELPQGWYEISTLQYPNNWLLEDEALKAPANRLHTINFGGIFRAGDKILVDVVLDNAGNESCSPEIGVDEQLFTGGSHSITHFEDYPLGSVTFGQPKMFVYEVEADVAGVTSLKFKSLRSSRPLSCPDEAFVRMDNFAIIGPYTDIDGDGITGFEELDLGLDPRIDDLLADNDGDGLNNSDEIFHATDINNPDSDADGLLDGSEINDFLTDPLSTDTDDDGLDDKWEVDNGLLPNDDSDATADLDGDGYSNYEEYLTGTDPTDINSMPAQIGGFSESFEDDNYLIIWKSTPNKNPFTSVDEDSFSGLKSIQPVSGINSEVTISGDFEEGVISFMLEVSSEKFFLLIDGELTNNLGLSTQNNWASVSYLVPAGVHQLTFANVNPLYVPCEEPTLACRLANLRYGQPGMLSIDTVKFVPAGDDVDVDGMSDTFENDNGLNLGTNDSSLDLDGDGFSNLEEFLAGTNPNNAISFPAAIIIDENDLDGDGLTNDDEISIHSTDPENRDSDNDLTPDGWELQYGFNPLNSADASLDTDNDGYSNLEEFGSNSNPLLNTSTPQESPWQTYQGNAQHTGYVPLTIDIDDTKELWRKTVFGGDELHPVVSFNSKVFVSNDINYGPKKLSALNLNDGIEIWQHDFGNIFELSGPAISGGKVFVQTGASDDTFLYGFDEQSGNIQIQSTFSSQFYNFIAPTPFGSNVYIQGGLFGGAYSFQATTGDQKWFSTLAQKDSWAPAVNDSHVFVCLGAELTALNRQTGLKAYGIATPSCNATTPLNTTSPVIGADSNAFVVGYGDLVAFNLAEESIKWIRRSGYSEMPAVGLGLVVAITNGALAVHNEKDGSLIWKWEPPSGDLEGNLVLTNSHIFTSTSDATYAISLQTQQQEWSYEKAGHLVISEGMLFISSDDGALSAISLLDTDSDGIADNWELEYGLDPKNPADASEDLDGDNLTNLQEYQEGSNPTLTDSDGDTLSDYDEVTVHTTSPIKQDTDNDGMRDDWEVGNGFDPLDPSDAAMDADGDNATNLEEYGQGTNPTSSDSDGDGIDDGFEIANGLNPLVKDSSSDRDDDGFSNLEEFIAGSNPLDETDKPADPELTFGNQLCSFNTDAITASIHPQSDKAYIPNRASNTIDIITVTRVGCVSKSIPTAGEPQDVAFSEDGSKYFVTIDSAQELHIYDVETDELTNAIPLPATGYEVVAGSGTIYVSGLNAHQGIMRIDAATEVYIDSFGSGNLAYTKVALELSPNAKRLFFANRNTGSYVPGVLSVYDVSGEIPLLLNTTYPAGVLGPDGRSLSVDPLNGSFVSYATAGQYSYGGDTSGKIYKLPSDDFFAPSGHFLTGPSAKVIEYSHNGVHAYTVNTSDEIKVWNSNEFTLEETLTVSGEARDVVESWSQRYLVVPTDESLQILYLREDGGSCFNHACDPNSWWRFKLIQP